MNSTSQTRPAGSFSSHQRTVLWVLWLTYGSFYFCRNNPRRRAPRHWQRAGLDKNQLGTVLMALKLTYGVGPSINGQLAERPPPRKLLAPERITLNPDYDFAPGSGAVVSIDAAYRKLCHEAEAARMLRAEVA